MIVSVILAHPKPDSFNHAIASRATATLRELGHGVRFHDLHAERFDPVLPLEELPSEAPLPAVVARRRAPRGALERRRI